MPRAAIDQNSRMSLRIRPEQKKLLMRAVSLQDTDLTDFVLRHALQAARHAVEQAERVKLTERDSVRVLDLLEAPPKPNARLLAAAKSLPKER